jgi:D-tagatose-1,6-bisphosphate aldolase subunit GatZ/KbaZ
VQPGVDFDHSDVQHYDPQAARALSDFVETQPRIVFEAHSTDYQREASLHALVRDHFAILKVGPAATFAYREALFALAAIERELLPQTEQSRLLDVLDECMVAHPKYRQNHYRSDEQQLRLLRRYALSDRCRYYWGEPDVQAAVNRLIDNLQRHAPPLTLLSQFMPEQHAAVAEGQLARDPHALIQHRIFGRLAEYARACACNRAGAQSENVNPEAAVLSKR